MLAAAVRRVFLRPDPASGDRRRPPPAAGSPQPATREAWRSSPSLRPGLHLASLYLDADLRPDGKAASC